MPTTKAAIAEAMMSRPRCNPGASVPKVLLPMLAAFLAWAHPLSAQYQLAIGNGQPKSGHSCAAPVNTAGRTKIRL